MNIKRKEKLVTLMLIGIIILLPVKSSVINAQEDVPSEKLVSSQNRDFAFDVGPSGGDRKVKTTVLFTKLKGLISSSENELVGINEMIDDTSLKLDETSSKISSLKDQLANLDLQIEKSKILIENYNNKIILTNLEIEELAYQVEQVEIEVAYQKQMLAAYLNAIYKDQADINIFHNGYAEMNSLELLLQDRSAGDFLRSLRYSEVLENQGRLMVTQFSVLMKSVEQKRQLLEIKNYDLKIYQQGLVDEKNELELNKLAKQNLLKETQGQEAIYKELLKQSKAQQADVAADITTLRKNLAFIQKRIAEQGDNFNPDNYESLLRVGENGNLMRYILSKDGSGFDPIWPVSSTRGISAYFRELSYYKVFGMQHNAVDIRAYQETPIKAVESGVVYKAKDNGYGYSYIILLHENGYMTTYGHVFNILVEEGGEVKKGEIIGLSGGMPGTKGAGVFTTGPHLHFELLKDDTYVDPLLYLDLTFLDFDSLPSKYIDKALGDRDKIKREASVSQTKVKRNI